MVLYCPVVLCFAPLPPTALNCLSQRFSHTGNLKLLHSFKTVHSIPPNKCFIIYFASPLLMGN